MGVRKDEVVLTNEDELRDERYMKMLIFGAEFTARPGMGGPLAAQVSALRDAAAAATDQAWWAWAVVAGRPYGSFMLSTRFDGLAALIAGQQAAAASPGFQAVGGGVYGDLASGPAVTTTSDVVAMTGEPTAPKQFIVITQAQINGGRMADALAWSGRVIEHAKSVTGVDSLLVTSTAGTMFQVGFIAGVDTAAELDDINTALAADATYLEMLDEAGDLFATGSSQRLIAMQMT